MKTRIFVILCACFSCLLLLVNFLFIEPMPGQTSTLMGLLSSESYEVTSNDSTSLELSPADSLLEAARKSVDEARYDSAIAIAQSTRQLYEVSGDQRGIVNSVEVESNALIRSGHTNAAINLIEKYKGLTEKWFGKNDLGLARIKDLYGNSLRNIGDYDGSLQFHLDALRIQQAHPDRKEEDLAGSYNNVGIVYAERGRLDKAVEFYTKSLEIRESSLGKYHLDVAQSYNNLGNLYKNLGDYDQSLNYHWEALKIREQKSNPVALGASYYNIGNVMGLIDELDLALDFHNNALRLWNAALSESHFYVHVALGAIGVDYEKKGDLRNALKQASKTLELQKKYLPDYSPNLGMTYHNIGALYYKMGNYKKALEFYYRSLVNDVVSLSENHPKVSRHYNAIAETYYDQESLDKALYYVKKAYLSNLKANDEKLETTDISDFFSIKSLKSTLFLKARTLYSQSERVEGKFNRKELLEVLLILTHLRDVIEHYGSSFRSEGSKLVHAREANFIYSLAILVAEELYKLTKDASYYEHVFAFMEQGKVGVLRDALTEADARRFSQIPDSVLAIEKSLRVDLSFYDQKLASELAKGDKADSAKVSIWRTRTFELNRSYNALLDSLESSYPDYYDLKYKSYTASIADVQQYLLDDDEALIEYFVGEDQVYALAVTDNDVAFHATPTDSLHLQIEAFRQAILSKETSSLSDAGNLLYNQLVKPLEPIIKLKPHWVIVPHGVLNYIPFEILPTDSLSAGDSQKKFPYVLREHSVRYIYSASVEINSLKRKETMQPSWDYDFLAFAPVFEQGVSSGSVGAQVLSGQRGRPTPLRFDLGDETIVWPPEEPAADSARVSGDENESTWGYLPFTKQEVTDIQALFHKDYSWKERLWDRKAKVLLQDDATEEMLKSMDLTRHRFIHFATHGVVNESTPTLSGILLNTKNESEEDGVLHLGEIYNLELNAELVVLSACETGLGKLADGEGIIGLARGFKYAGANAMLVSLWPVDDASTSQLMRSFYSKLLDGKAKAEAVRQAKLDMADNHMLFSAPYHWAGFILIGE